MSNNLQMENILTVCISKIFKIIHWKEKDVHFNMSNINECYTKIYEYLVSDEEDKNGKNLYELYSLTLEKFYKEKIVPEIENSNNFIDSIVNFYRSNEICVKYLSLLILRYLERYYIKNNGIKTIQEKSKEVFENVIYQRYENKIIDITLNNLNNCRNNNFNEYNISMLFSLISEFNNLDEKNIIYKNIKESTKNYFSNYKIELIDEKNYEKYYSELTKSYQIENKIFKNIFSDELYKLHTLYIDNIVIKEKLEYYNQKDYVMLSLQNKEYDKIQILYNLLKKVNEEYILLPYILDSSKQEFKNLESISENIEKYINSFIDINKEYEIIFKKSFDNKDRMIYDYKKQVSLLTSNDVNIKGKKYSFIKLLVNHINYYLSKKSHYLENDFMDKYFSIVLNLNEKDYYIELYSKFLAKRLLFTNYDLDKESEILSVLKKNFGFSSTIKIENMIKDILLSKDNDIKYKILTLTHWPSYKNTKCNLPKEISDCLQEYKQEYNDKFNQRIIEWNNDISTVVFNLNLDKKYQITCTFIEISILNMFIKKLTYNILEIKENLSIDESKLLIYLNNLIKYKLLLSNEKDISETSEISFNTNFKSNKLRFTIPIPSIEKSKDEQKNKEQVYENRNEIIKAGIVRIMKSKKTINHNNIIIELNKNISLFQPSVKDIKKCIENLIEREYLERSEKDQCIYNYLA